MLESLKAMRRGDFVGGRDGNGSPVLLHTHTHNKAYTQQSNNSTISAVSYGFTPHTHAGIGHASGTYVGMGHTSSHIHP